MAALVAANEAVAKALGGPADMYGQHCQVGVDASGAPHVVAIGTVADAKGVKKRHPSLSQDGNAATANVVVEG